MLTFVSILPLDGAYAVVRVELIRNDSNLR